MLRLGVRQALADPGRARYFVAEDPVFVGCLFVTPEWSDWTGGWYWWVQGVYVEPGRRGRGVYRALVDAVADEARRQGIRKLRLYVHEGNTAGRKAHEAVGFHEAPYRVHERDP